MIIMVFIKNSSYLQYRKLFLSKVYIKSYVCLTALSGFLIYVPNNFLNVKFEQSKQLVRFYSEANCMYCQRRFHIRRV